MAELDLSEALRLEAIRAQWEEDARNGSLRDGKPEAATLAKLPLGTKMADSPPRSPNTSEREKTKTRISTEYFDTTELPAIAAGVDDSASEIDVASEASMTSGTTFTSIHTNRACMQRSTEIGISLRGDFEFLRHRANGEEDEAGASVVSMSTIRPEDSVSNSGHESVLADAAAAATAEAEARAADERAALEARLREAEAAVVAAAEVAAAAKAEAKESFGLGRAAWAAKKAPTLHLRAMGAVSGGIKVRFPETWDELFHASERVLGKPARRVYDEKGYEVTSLEVIDVGSLVYVTFRDEWMPPMPPDPDLTEAPTFVDAPDAEAAEWLITALMAEAERLEQVGQKEEAAEAFARAMLAQKDIDDVRMRRLTEASGVELGVGRGGEAGVSAARLESAHPVQDTLPTAVSPAGMATELTPTEAVGLTATKHGPAPPPLSSLGADGRQSSGEALTTQSPKQGPTRMLAKRPSLRELRSNSSLGQSTIGGDGKLHYVPRS